MSIVDGGSASSNYGNPAVAGSLSLVTHTVQDVLDYVTNMFGDTSGVQISGSDIVRWVNIGQEDIVQRNKVLRAVASSPCIPGQGDYRFLSDDVLYIDSLLYGNKLIPNMSWSQAQQMISRMDPQLNIQLPYPRFWYEWGGVITLWPVPQDASKDIKIFYIQKPTPVAQNTDLLSITDRYFLTLCEFCMGKAYEQDEDWVAVQAKTQQYEQRMRLHGDDERSAQDDHYETIGLIEGEYF